MFNVIKKLFSKPGEKKAEKLDHLKENWEALARYDPMWVIISDPAKIGRKWDKDEFFQTGEIETGHLINYIKRLGVKHEFGRALDFGCGIGRLSQAMAKYYGRVDGIDISEEMVKQADENNKYKDRVFYVANATDSLPYPGNTFNMIYSNIVLQHMDKRNALKYIEEFIRVIKPGGLAIFQAPSSCRTMSGQSKFISPIETSEGIYSIEMNLVPKEEVLQTLNRCGARVVDIIENLESGPDYISLRYCITKG